MSEEEIITPMALECRLLDDINKALNLEKYEKAKKLSEIYKNIRISDVQLSKEIFKKLLCDE